MQDFTDRIVVVTGAASGIGLSLVKAFLREGARGAVLADVNRAGLELAQLQLDDAGFDTVTVVTDVSKPEQVEDLAAEAYRAYGRVDVLCNNAAISWGGPATWESTLEDWQWVLGVNLMGAVHGVRSFVPRMIAQGGDSAIVNTSSILGLQGAYTNAAYPIAKHGVVVLSESIYNELKRRQLPISVHCLCPSFVNTAILESGRHRPADLAQSAELPSSEQGNAYIEWFLRQHKEGMQPEEVAEMVLSAIRSGEFYIVTHPKMKLLVERRLRAIIDNTEPVGLDLMRELCVEFDIEPPPKYFDEV